MRRAVLVFAVAACGDDGPGGVRFTKHVVDPAYRAEGVTFMDVDHDDNYDIVIQDLWYAGPDFTVAHEIRAPRTWDPTMEYAETFGAFHADIDGDTYDDLILIGAPGTAASWCRNPQGRDVHWDCFDIAPQVSGESPMYGDFFGIGKPVLLAGVEPQLALGWLAPGADPTKPWGFHAISQPGFQQAEMYEHGLGVGDLNRDLKLDVLTGSGWLAQPADLRVTPWTWHPVTISPNNVSHMFTYDINGDGLADILGTSPHGYGVWWWQQMPNATGDPTFVQHLIDDTISQTHAARFADLDGDRVPELVTGKRWFAHFTADPGALEPAMLVYYQMERHADHVTWARHVIDDDSGVGTQFEVFDINKDGKLDIIVANKKGVFYFEQQ